MRSNNEPKKLTNQNEAETIDLSSDDIIVVDAKELGLACEPQNSILKSLVVSVLCGALVGVITKVGSQWVMDRYLVDRFTTYEKQKPFKNFRGSNDSNDSDDSDNFDDFRSHFFGQNFGENALEQTITKEEALKNLEFKDDQKPTQDEIRIRYKELALKYHPDREGGSVEQFRMIDEAYKSLKK
jgi:hypothetical protein